MAKSEEDKERESRARNAAAYSYPPYPKDGDAAARKAWSENYPKYVPEPRAPDRGSPRRKGEPATYSWTAVDREIHHQPKDAPEGPWRHQVNHPEGVREYRSIHKNVLALETEAQNKKEAAAKFRPHIQQHDQGNRNPVRPGSHTRLSDSDLAKRLGGDFAFRNDKDE